jgi:hypothetical protein
MPNLRTVFRWSRERPAFSHPHARAKAERAEALVEEMLAIADDDSGDFVADGDRGVKFNLEHVQPSRLRVDTRKRVASKMTPRVHGDRLNMNHAVQPENSLAVLILQFEGSCERSVYKHREGESVEIDWSHVCGKNKTMPVFE